MKMYICLMLSRRQCNMSFLAFLPPAPLFTACKPTFNRFRSYIPAYKSPLHAIGRRQSIICEPRHGRNALPCTMVFTGIVEEMGTVLSLQNLDNEDGGVNMVVSAQTCLSGVNLGDSIAVNGTCLTVTQIKDGSFTFGLAPETLRCTNLGDLSTGSLVNLERSLAADGRFGGHVVQGHVDCTGCIKDIKREKDAIWYTISIPQENMKYIVEKGYIAIDGTSLTVCDVIDEQNCFTFMMIPYTQAHVVIALKDVNSIVNIEVDITGKYIERIMAAKRISV